MRIGTYVHEHLEAWIPEANAMLAGAGPDNAMTQPVKIKSTSLILKCALLPEDTGALTQARRDTHHAQLCANLPHTTNGMLKPHRILR